MMIQTSNTQKKNVAINTSELIYNYFSSEKVFLSASSFVKEFTTMINLLSKNAETLTIILTDTSGNIKFSTDSAFSDAITDESALEMGAGDLIPSGWPVTSP